MSLSNLRKSIHYLQQSIRHDNDDKRLYEALDILTAVEVESIKKDKENNESNGQTNTGS